jgi:hypothetical protein
MYFPNAFRKSFLPASTTLASSGGTDALTAGQIGFFDAKTFQAVTAQAAPFIFAQGSYFAADKIGPVHGGYKESVKSKVINPKYISRLIKVSAKTAKNHIVKVDATGCTVSSDNTYRLRLDVKGSPALRFLNHQLYKTLDAYSGCDAVVGTTNTVDAAVVLLKWKDQVNGAPLLKDMISAKVWKKAAATTTTAASSTTVIAVTSATGIVAGQKVVGTGVGAGVTVVSVASLNVTVSAAVNVASGAAVKFYTEIATETYTAETVANNIAAVDAHLELTSAYIETKFGTCTFTPTDFYEKEPLFIYASLIDESGDPCAVNCFPVSELQTPVQVQGLGETVLREMILDGRYLQNAYPDSSRVDSLRMREIEADPALAAITRSSLYDRVLILHNVPRFNNPSSTFDNDQYLLVVHVPTGTATTSITNFIASSATAAGNSVSLESF